MPIILLYSTVHIGFGSGNFCPIIILPIYEYVDFYFDPILLMS